MAGLALAGWAGSAAEPGTALVTVTNPPPSLQLRLPTGQVERLSILRLSEDHRSGTPSVWFPLRSVVATHRIVSAGVEEAECLNAQAMRRYRERWAQHLGAPGAVPAPCLYPSGIEEVLAPRRPAPLPLNRKEPRP